MHDLEEFLASVEDGPESLAGLGRTVVVAHDNGAAEHIAAWLPSLGTGAVCSVDGPALRILDAKGFPWRAGGFDQIAGADCLLVGTGWQTDYERRAMRLASDFGIPCLAVVDHWCNYRERFEDYGSIRPDAIIVTDQYAESLARELLAPAPVILWPNVYLEQVRRSIDLARHGLPRSSTRNIVFLAEPINRNLTSAEGQPETEALLATLRWIAATTSEGGDWALRLRLHPAEDPRKYDSISTKIRGHAQLSEGRALAEDLAWADTAVGFTTYALYVAAMCGIEVFTVAPLIGRETYLPRDLVHDLPVWLT